MDHRRKEDKEKGDSPLLSLLLLFSLFGVIARGFMFARCHSLRQDRRNSWWLFRRFLGLSFAQRWSDWSEIRRINNWGLRDEPPFYLERWRTSLRIALSCAASIKRLLRILLGKVFYNQRQWAKVCEFIYHSYCSLCSCKSLQCLSANSFIVSRVGLIFSITFCW